MFSCQILKGVYNPLFTKYSSSIMMLCFLIPFISTHECLLKPQVDQLLISFYQVFISLGKEELIPRHFSIFLLTLPWWPSSVFCTSLATIFSFLWLNLRLSVLEIYFVSFWKSVNYFEGQNRNRIEWFCNWYRNSRSVFWDKIEIRWDNWIDFYSDNRYFTSFCIIFDVFSAYFMPTNLRW